MRITAGSGRNMAGFSKRVCVFMGLFEFQLSVLTAGFTNIASYSRRHSG
jgi:hypothetical protein